MVLPDPLFENVPDTSICWMSHTNIIKEVPVGFSVIATTSKCPCAAMCDDSRKLYGVQFYPEVANTECGTTNSISENLTCVFVDHGLLRKDEGDFTESDSYECRKALLGKIIGEEFIRVFEEEAKTLGKIDMLAQGTIYPDVAEIGKGDSATIKSHHGRTSRCECL